MQSATGVPIQALLSDLVVLQEANAATQTMIVKSFFMFISLERIAQK
jgi:hypothetical protein